MKEIIVSIKPEWIKKIADGEKTIEVRKSAPKDVPFKAYIYASSSGTWSLCFDRSEDAFEKVCLTANCRSKEISARNYNLEIVSGYIVGEFVCDKIITVDYDSVAPFNRDTGDYIDKETQLSRDDLWAYTHGKCAYGWHITELVIYDKPNKLSDFYKKCKGNCFSGCPYYRGKDEDCDKPVFMRPPQSWCYAEKKDY